MVISPGWQDATILSVVHNHLVKRGIVLIPAPEADRRVIEQYAHVRELPYLRWYPETRARNGREEFTVLPVTNNVLFTELLVYFQKDAQRSSAKRFGHAVRDFIARIETQSI
jgi:hypothetical protein